MNSLRSQYIRNEEKVHISNKPLIRIDGEPISNAADTLPPDQEENEALLKSRPASVVLAEQEKQKKSKRTAKKSKKNTKAKRKSK